MQQEGDDIIVEKEIPFSEAVLGTSVEVPTLEGTKKVRVFPGTQSQTAPLPQRRRHYLDLVEAFGSGQCVGPCISFLAVFHFHQKN
jgi:hypothetical protein